MALSLVHHIATTTYFQLGGTYLGEGAPPLTLFTEVRGR
jgi:hypothetical protein